MPGEHPLPLESPIRASGSWAPGAGPESIYDVMVPAIPARDLHLFEEMVAAERDRIAELITPELKAEIEEKLSDQVYGTDYHERRLKRRLEDDAAFAEAFEEAQARLRLGTHG